MRSTGRRWASGARALLSVALLALLPCCGIFRELGLGGDEAQWAERSWRGVNASSVLQLVQTVVEDRYPPQQLDASEGTFETGWVYGAYAELTHQALRQRVVVETVGAGDVVTLRMRVQQETSPSAGRSASREADDWEPTDDDPFEAKRLLTKLQVLMRDIAESVDPAPAGS